jgi:nitroreductase
MDNTMEQLNEDKGQDEYYEGNSKKRNRQSCPLSYKILIFITVISSLLSLYLIYSSVSKKNSGNFLWLAESRFSVRKYDSKPVEKEKIEKLLRVAQVAPTAANKQPQKIYIITKDEDREKLKTVTKYTFNAPIFFVVCIDKDKAWKHKTEDTNSVDIDGSIIATQILLEAHDLGLGSVYVRAFQTEELKKLFNIPENIKPVALLPLGYPKENAKPAPSHFKKKNIDEMVEYL